MSLCARMLTRTIAAIVSVVGRDHTRWPPRSRPSREHDHGAQRSTHSGSTTSHRLPNTRARGWPPGLAANRTSMSEAVNGTAHAERAAIEHVRVHHRRADVGMTQQLLYRSNVVPVLKHVRRKRMPKRVWTHSLGDTRSPGRVRHRLLDDRFVKVEPGRRSPSRIHTHPRGGKDELPGPLGRRVWVLAVERERQDDAAESSREIGPVLPFDSLQMSNQRLNDRVGNTVDRSFWPFPRPITICRLSRSRSLTRSSRHSTNRSPAP